MEKVTIFWSIMFFVFGFIFKYAPKKGASLSEKTIDKISKVLLILGGILFFVGALLTIFK